jgi:hypothetical protein
MPVDTRVNDGWPAYENILKKNKVAHVAYFMKEWTMVSQQYYTALRKSSYFILDKNNRFFKRTEEEVNFVMLAIKVELFHFFYT